jgi:hypothetical protein
MQPGYTIVQLNRVSEKEGKRLIHRTLALVLGVVMAETHTTKGGDPALNLLVLRKNVSESLLGGPDWPLAFERLHAVKHLDHGDIAAGTETVFWSDLPLELNDEVDFDVFQKYLQNPSDADLAAVQQEQEIARATAGKPSQEEVKSPLQVRLDSDRLPACLLEPARRYRVEQFDSCRSERLKAEVDAAMRLVPRQQQQNAAEGESSATATVGGVFRHGERCQESDSSESSATAAATA